MSWVCPTLGRPERLKEAARSWERYGSDREVKVRIWTGDSRKADYFAETWPKGWTLYEGEHRDIAATLNEFYNAHPHDDFYGLVQDDVILKTPGGVEIVEALAHPFYVAFPNDTIQRHRLCTTFCLGGDLVRLMGWWVHPAFKKDYIDTVWYHLAKQTGLLRYAADVVWEHKHLIAQKSGWDETYGISYDRDGKFQPPKGEVKSYERYMKSGEFASDVNRILHSLGGIERFWIASYEQGQESAVPDSGGESVQGEGGDSGGVGGRDSPGAEEVPRREPSRIHGSDLPDEPSPPVQREVDETGTGLAAGRSPWVAQPREYKYPELDVVICVPSTGTWQARTASSVAMNMGYFLQNGNMPGVKSARIHLHTVESSMLSKNREEAVRAMMRMGRTHIFFVDSDMVLPEDALCRLLNHDLPFVAANCTSREFPPLPTAHDFDGSKVPSAGRTGLQTVRQVGLAVALIRRDVFMKTQPPHFLMDWLPQAQGYCGEDIYFSQVLQQVGVDVVIDHDLSNEVGHVGWAIFGQNQVGCQAPPNWRVE